MELKKKEKSPKRLVIPKHRFDCVNLCLKETKELLRGRTAEVELLKDKIAELNKELFESKVETMLAVNGAKNIIAVKALIDFEVLEASGELSALEEQIALLKEQQSYLFESREESAYVLVPVKSGDSLNSSIANYVNQIGGAEK